MPDINKLPIWAQDHIRRIESKLEAANTELDQLRANTFGEPDSRVRIEHWEHTPTTLPEQQHITFQLNPDNPRRWIKVKLDPKNGRIELMGNTQLLVRPSVTNTLTVETEK